MSESKINLNKETEDSNISDKLSKSINSCVDSLNTTVNSVVDTDVPFEEVDTNILPPEQLEQLEQIGKQTEETIQYSIDSGMNSAQNLLNNLNVSFDKFYDSLGDKEELIDSKSLQVDAATSALLSFFMPGVGQIVNGQSIKGLRMIIWTFIINVVVGIFTCFLGLIISFPVTTFICVYDAYRCTKLLESGKRIRKDKMWTHYK